MAVSSLTQAEAVRVWERSRKYATMTDNALEQKTLEQVDLVLDDLQRQRERENFGATTAEDENEIVREWDGGE